MTSILSRGDNKLPDFERCPKCHGYIPPPGFKAVFEHEGICEYLIFKQTTAPSLRWVPLIEAGIEPVDLEAALIEQGIPHKTFLITGPGGRLKEIFGPSDLRVIIDTFNNKGGYAGMDLPEFIRRMYIHDESTTS